MLKFVEVSVNITIDRESIKLSDRIPSSDPPPCAMCDSEVLDDAVYGCKDCKGLLMCTACKDMHLRLRFSKGHSIYDLTKSADHAEVECREHGEPIKLCCEQCHARACALCTSIDHSGHKMTTLRVGAQEERAKLEQLIVEVQGLYDAKLAGANKALMDYTGDIAALKAELNELADRLIVLINEKRALALAEIDAKAAGYLERLRAEKRAVEGLVSRSRSCGRVAQRLLQEGSDAEIYELTPVSE